MRIVVDQDVRSDDGDPRCRAETRSWRAALGKIEETLDRHAEPAAIFHRDGRTGLLGKIGENVTGVCVGVGRDDEPGHRARKVSSFASRCLKNSSPDSTWPRASDARA